MSSRYRKLQIVKHALQYYVQRPNANIKDLAQEKNLLELVENEVDAFKQKNGIVEETK